MSALFQRAARWTLTIVCLAAALSEATRAQSSAQLLTPPTRASNVSASPPAKATLAERSPSLLPSVGGSTISVPQAVAQKPPAASRDLSLTTSADARSGLKVSKGAGTLPNEHGQVWREYDVSPYTLHVRDVAKPEQAIVDWILRETGTEVWFAEPLGVLNATSTTLRVYHTAEMHDRIRGIVERFVVSEAQSHALGVRLMTVGSPNWRSRALSLLKPVDVMSPGVEAWLLSRENAIQLYEQLKARGDFREHSSPHAEIANGQSHKLARTQSRAYTRSVQLKREFPFYDTIPGKIDEGYSLEISPLMSIDGQTMEAAISCNVDQIEKLVPLAIDVPTGSQSQRVQIQVPQVASWRLSERFRWPASEVLLLSCGVVASPAPSSTGPLAILSPLGLSSSRADALLMVEHRPPSVGGAAPATATASAAPVIPANTKPGSVAPPASPARGSATSGSRGRY